MSGPDVDGLQVALDVARATYRAMPDERTLAAYRQASAAVVQARGGVLAAAIAERDLSRTLAMAREYGDGDIKELSGRLADHRQMLRMARDYDGTDSGEVVDGPWADATPAPLTIAASVEG